MKQLKTSSSEIKDWQSKIKEIAESDLSLTEKFDEVSMMSMDYISEDIEIKEFEKTIIEDYKSGKYLADITDDLYMLTIMFKADVVERSYDDPNHPMATFSFDFWQNAKYTYRGVDAVDSESVLSNHSQMDRALVELE